MPAIKAINPASDSNTLAGSHIKALTIPKTISSAPDCVACCFAVPPFSSRNELMTEDYHK